jgi:hypothetical protein
MIFFAVAAPTPGSASSCDWVAVLRSTGAVAEVGTAVVVDLAVDFLAAAGEAVRRTRTRAVARERKPALLDLESM